MSELLWPFVSIVAVGAAWFSFKEWLDRIHPKREELDSLTADELRALIDEHREEVTKDLENLRGKIEMRAVIRPGMRS